MVNRYLYPYRFSSEAQAIEYLIHNRLLTFNICLHSLFLCPWWWSHTEPPKSWVLTSFWCVAHINSWWWRQIQKAKKSPKYRIPDLSWCVTQIPGDWGRKSLRNVEYKLHFDVWRAQSPDDGGRWTIKLFSCVTHINTTEKGGREDIRNSEY